MKKPLIAKFYNLLWTIVLFHLTSCNQEPNTAAHSKEWMKVKKNIVETALDYRASNRIDSDAYIIVFIEERMDTVCARVTAGKSSSIFEIGFSAVIFDQGLIFIVNDNPILEKVKLSVPEILNFTGHSKTSIYDAQTAFYKEINGKMVLLGAS